MTKHVCVYKLGETSFLYPSVITFEWQEEAPSICFHVFNLEALFVVNELQTVDSIREFELLAGESKEVELNPNSEVGVYRYSVFEGENRLGRPDGPIVIIHPPTS